MRRILSLLLALLLPVSLAAADPIGLRSDPVPLDRRDAAREQAGELRFLAGFELASGDPRWGGFSSMILTDDGDRLLAVSDFGHWLRLDLAHGDDGRLTGVGAAEMGILAGPEGIALEDKGDADAEGLAVGPNGGLVVAFERRHRLWLYDGAEPPFGAAPAAFPAPRAIVALPANGGVEALASLPGGDMVALAEGRDDGAAESPAWLWRDAHWRPLAWTRTPPYRPTDAAALPGGDLLVLERSYSLARGAGARLSVVPAAAIMAGARLAGREIAVLAPPLTIDNFEGVATQQAPDGSVLVYLLSDDNRNLLQRTLLLQFRWTP